MDRLGSIIAFVKTADQSSFVGAGRALGLSASAVGKSVAKLEDDLGVRLFHRTTRRVTLTEEGAAFHERCRHILDDLHDAEAALRSSVEAPRGRLRISLPTIGYRFLLPVVPEFRRLYPEIELDLDFNDRIVDVIEAGLDAAIRSGDLADSSLMSRRLGPFRFVLCASPSYLERAGMPRSPGDLDGHEGLRFRFPTSGKLQDWAFRGTATPPRPRTVMTCSNMEALREAAIAGLGLAYMPDFLAKDAIEAGRLVTVLDGCPADAGQFSILWPSSQHLSPKLRVLVDFLSGRLFKAELRTSGPPSAA